MYLRLYFLFATALFFFNASAADTTYAEKLGYPRGSKVLILHVDDVGMSQQSNEGAVLAMTKGVANSCSMMMTCAWVPDFMHYLKAHPGMDVGLHLTLTSEWEGYRWGPLAGKPQTPGLVDNEGALWSSVAAVVQHASTEEVDKEMRAQLERARNMGWEPTHFDSHMGTLFATPEYLQRYVKLGIENKIPVMLPAGHATLIQQQLKAPDAQIQQMRAIGRVLWNSGLPVIDDLHNDSYGWTLPKGIKPTDAALRAHTTKKYISALRSLKPGITMMIMHCTNANAAFTQISDSGPIRRADMLAMLDPALKKVIESEGIILTTWRQLTQKRNK